MLTDYRLLRRWEMENNNILNNLITPDVINNILNDKAARIAIVSKSHYWFFHLYFHEYVHYPTANFQKELFSITQDNNIKMAVIVAFRESAKSTIMTMSYPLWAVLGEMQKKCVVIISQTQSQVRTHFANLKRELEGNILLKSDLGPFQEESDEWGSYSIVIPRFDARIVAVSSEQSIRGIRHGAHRPDLIICDDVEDINSVKTKESRDKIFEWFTGEIIPLGDIDSKIIVVGNLLHEDSLLMRLKKNIEEEKIDGIIREYPILIDNVPLWPEKFVSLEIVERYKKKVGSDKAWQREYMLKILPDEDQIIFREWLNYYDELPSDTDQYRYTITAVDLAISQTASADYTAMITAHVYGFEEKMKIYILPTIFNRKVNFPTIIEELKQLSRQIFPTGERTRIYVEDVAFQKAVIQQLGHQNIDVKGFKVMGQDKRARLTSVSSLVKFGQVLFPKQGVDQLVQQLLYFGVEKHDDLVDAFSMLLLIALQRDTMEPCELTPEICGLLRGGGGSYIPRRDIYGGGYFF